MHPALSIILFTTLSGGGLGLGFWTVVVASSEGPAVVAIQAALAAALGGAGLFCSVFHLRRPTRAWRAFSQWRSSWLSREGIVAPAALAVVVLFGGAVLAGATGWPLLALRVAGALLCAAALFATAMIYAQIAAVPAWNTALTPVFMLLFAAAGGGLLFAGIASAFGTARSNEALLLAMLLVVAWAAKFAWWKRLDRIGTGKSSVASATGLQGLGEVRLLEPPHTGSNYLLSEMAFFVARKHAQKLRAIAVLVGGALPIAVLAAAYLGMHETAAFAAAALLHLFGVGVTRWLFFAESKHTVTLYYQR